MSFSEVLDFLQPYVMSMDMALVHAIIAAPFLFILMNFLNGGCDVAERAGLYRTSKGKIIVSGDDATLEEQEEEDEEDDDNQDNKKSSSSLLDDPRISIALMMVAFFWQVHAVWFVADRYLKVGLSLEALQIDNYLSKPGVPTEFAGLFVYSFHKIWKSLLHEFVKYLYTAHAICCVGYLLCCIVVWKRALDERNKFKSITTYRKYMKAFFPLGGVEKEAPGYLSSKTDNTRVSFCSKCRTPIVGRDHHCRWLGTCIGANSRLAYVFSLVFGFLFAAADSILGFITLPILNDLEESRKLGDVTFDRYYILAGYLFSIAAALFLAWQTGVQINLLREGQTKLGRKCRREANLILKQNKDSKKHD